MRTIRISDEVWNEIAKRGKFRETEDDVLRRVFQLPAAQPPERTKGSRPRRNYATVRMHADVHSDADGKRLVVSFEGGERNEWRLPDKSKKEAIRDVRDKAVKFALSQGATDPGQTNAVRKALTNHGYYLTK